MNEYDNIIQSYTEAGPALATSAIGADPERATRALQLSRATGVPPLAVYNDLDGVEADHKANLTANIVRGNSQISAYIRVNDLADHVSNDDYGNLDNFSREANDLTSISGITKHILSDVFKAPIKGAEVMAEQAMQPYWFNKNFPEFAAKNPYSTALYNLPEAALRTFSIPFAGIAGAAGEYAKTAVTAITADPMQGERAGRDIGGMVDYYFMGVTGHMPHTYGEMIHAKQFDNAVRASQREFYQEAVNAAKPWLNAGVDVPRGVHPLTDSIKANVNTEWVDKIQKVLDESLNSATKERDPELFRNFARQHFEDAQMGISGDRVAALYGDKLPEPGDGLLGWVPGIAEKLEAAKTFGEDVHVPLADWVTYMDPTLAREMKDDIRAWPGGITKNEAAVKDLAAPAIDGALPQVRTSAALEPMFAIGDRPLKLEKGESIWKGMEDYNFVDHTGKVVGEITIFPDPMKKQLYIASVSSHDLQPNTMGPSLIRDIKRQLKELYPEYETISGYRISGAREEAGAPKEQRKPVVKLALGDAFEMSKEYTDLRNILEQAYSGELAQRGQGEVRPGDAFAKGEIENQLRAEAAGLDAKSFKKIQELIQKRYQEDISAAVKRAEQEQRTIQSKEWKEQAREVRKESEADVRARPDVQADLLIGSGELGGKKLERNRYELRAEDLSPEQKAALPRHYYSKDGVPVDVMANLFGYSDGNHLIEALAEVNKGKEGRSAQENLKRLIDEETNRRMEEKYGKLQDNIMLDAMDQALSETNLQILSEEWQGAAMAAGVKVVDKNIAKEEALRMFGDMKLADINVERLLGIMGKIGRDTERLLIAGKNAEALVQMQRKYQTALIAAEARKIQKEQASADKTFKTLSKREVPSMEPEYTDYAHQIMQQIGKPVRRSVQDLQEALNRHGYGGLKDFIEHKQQDLRAIDAWDQLYDTNWRKDYAELTTSEFRAIHDTIKTLVHNGREERKIYKAGEAADWADLKTEFVDSIENAAHGKLAKVGKGKKSLLPDQYFTGVVQMETFLNRLDGYNPRNNWFQYVFRGLADGTAQFDKWKKDYAKKISALPSPDNLGRTIENPLFKNQKNDMPLTFTRRDLIGVMLNTGNDTNLVKMSHGYKLKSDDVMAWVNQHATKQDWDFVQGIWDIFKEIKRDTDTMYRSLSGVAPENIQIRPVDTPHGQYAGGYYPLIRHPEFGDVATKRFKDVLAQENWVNTLPAAGHTKLRTGAIYPLATNLDYMVGHMNQMLFDNAMRPAIIQASKVFHDTSIKNAIYKYFGQAWEGELHDYIEGVANSQNYMAKNMQGFAWLSETLRQNMIGNVVGLNPSTPMKHGPTALVLSMKEVGAMEFAKAVRMLHTVNETTGAKWMKFVNENSLEIQRRDRNWQETLFGGVASHDPTNATEYYRQKMIQFAAKPVAWSDMASARPTWLAAYLKAMEEGSDHGEAVALGDRAVRRAHGSTATTSRTAVQRNWNPWFVSIYNFWSDILNRQIETVWKAGDIYKLTEGNPVQKGLATAPTILGGAFAYVLWPMIVENVVSPHPHKDDESWASKAGKSLMFTLSGGWPILRDIGSAMAMGRDPQMGFTGTALSTGYNVLRDLAKNEPFNKEHAGKLIQDWMSVVGGLTGGPGVQLGRVMRFGHDVYTGKENPKNAWQWMVGLRYGTTNRHSQSWDDYWKGKH